MDGLATGLLEAGEALRISTEAAQIEANDRNSVSRCGTDRILVGLRGWSFASGSGDRNYARAPVLKRFLADACGKADFIVRLGWNALQLSTPRGKPFDLIGYLQHLPADANPHEVILHAAAGRGETGVAAASDRSA